MEMKRREFLKYAGIIGGVGAFPQILSADNSSQFSDFKAIILIDMQGGNDALNTFIPTGSDSKTGYSNYVKQRASGIAIPDTNLMGALRSLVNGQLEIGSASQNPYYTSGTDAEKHYMKGFYLLDNQQTFNGKIAVNAMMPELAYWLDRGRGAVIQNVGNIAAPYTKSELLSDKSKQPPSLFAHNIQNLLAHLGTSHSMTVPTGWLGKLADKWGNVNGDPIYKMNINLSGYGVEHAMFGANTSPMNYSYMGPDQLNSSLNDGFEHWVNEVRTAGNQGIFRNLARELRKNSYTETVATLTDWNAISQDTDFKAITDVYGNSIYDNGTASKGQMAMSTPINNRVVESFKTAAKLIAIAKQKGFNRITMSIVVPGFDQHSHLKRDHSVRLRGLSAGVDAFMRAMETKGWLDEVVVVSLSDFSRSTAGNSDGSNHAWGGTQFVLGAVNPGNYGQFPDLTVSDDQDISHRGRIIPTTSYSEYYGKILEWFGASSSEIDYALPERQNFNASRTDLDFMA